MTDFIPLGRILRPHGIRGEVVVELTPPAAAEDLAGAQTVYVGEPPVAHAVAEQRWHRGRLLLRLAGCMDRDGAEMYRGLRLALAAEAAAPLPPGTYYWRDILGITVVTDAGETLGPVTEILETGANDVYVVQSTGGEVLIPAAPGVVLNVDLAARQMTVHLLEGLR